MIWKLANQNVNSVMISDTHNDQQNLWKEPVKLIEWVKIALLFLNVTSELFQFTILDLFVCQRNFQNDLLTRATQVQ